jgi:phosphoribosylglycinamide formyltransferase-1
MEHPHARPAATSPGGHPPRPVRPIVFAYGFPHKKTQDVILRLTTLGVPPLAVLAAPWERLRIPLPAVRVKPRHADLIHPADLCRTLAIEYHLVDHRSDTCLLLLDQLRPELGVIAGARVLSGAVLDYFRHGIVNLHPGLLPHVRGLDALQWSLYHEVPLGVTAHVVDTRVDAGWIIERRLIDVHEDDTLVDLGLRLYETQLAMLGPALTTAATTDRYTMEPVADGAYRGPFPAHLASVLLERVERLRSAPSRVPPAAVDNGHGRTPLLRNQ